MTESWIIESYILYKNNGQIWTKRTHCSLYVDGKEEPALEFEASNTKSNNLPSISVEYCECWKKLKF